MDCIQDKKQIYTMNSKDFTAELAQRLGMSAKDAGEIVSTMIGGMTQQLQEGNQVAIHSFGSFEVKKKNERISVNPLTRERFLVPPKLILAFRPSALLKDEFNKE
jgi:DNA-binding protein HU-beta